jgi:hypothetical protein
VRPEEKISLKQGRDRQIIFEMIEASINLSEKKGDHPLERGCNCIVCINKRKRQLQTFHKSWKYRL